MTTARQLFSGFDLRQNDRQPLYAALKRHIAEAVEQGRLKEGDFVPSERDVADLLQVSRVTVRKAFANLAAEGILSQRRGSGTMVRRPAKRFEESMSRLTSFTEDMRLRGLQTSAEWLGRAASLPSPEEAMKLSLSPNDNVLRFSRLRRANDLPLAIEISAVPAHWLPGLEAVDTSLYEALQKVGARPVRAMQRLHAIALPSDKASLLHVATGAPALFIERVGYLASGAAVEYTRSWFRGDSYDFVAELVTVPEAS